MISSSPGRSAKTCCVTEERIWSITGTACSLLRAKTWESRSRQFASALYDCSCAKSEQSRGMHDRLRVRHRNTIKEHVGTQVEHKTVQQLVHLAVEIVGVWRGRLRQKRHVQLQQAKHFLRHFPAETVRRGVLRDPAEKRAETAEVHRDYEP